MILPVRVITDDERRARLAARHALTDRSRAPSVEAAVDAMTCLHGTEPASIYMACFARARATRAQIDRALYEERTIVRQLAMRRTVFAFPRAIFPSVLGSAAARVAGQEAGRLAKSVEASGLVPDGNAWLQETMAAVLARIRDGPATTAQLRAEIPALALRLTSSPGKSYASEGPVAPQVVTALAATGAIVRGHNDAGWKVPRPQWTATEDWMGTAVQAAPADAGYAALVNRWLWTFGPGTEADIVWWLGATKSAVRRALADVEAVAVCLEDGTEAWLHADDSGTIEPPAPWAALLPALDPTTMGWKQRDFYLGPHADLIFDRNGNGGPTAWWNGRIVGGWSQTADGTVVVLPAAPLPAGAAGPLADAAAELTDWLAGDVVRTVYQSPLSRSHAAGLAHPPG